jgi:hypothetical protein
MAFIEENNSVVSFADFDDVRDRDRRLFDINEGLTDFYIEDLLIRSTERILNKLRSTDWWQKNWISRNPEAGVTSAAQVPTPNPNKIIGRRNDFTDLTVYFALSEYIYPTVADFGNDEDSERNKMMYYATKWEDLYREIVKGGDWYDWDGDGDIDQTEKSTGRINLKRIR